MVQNFNYFIDTGMLTGSNADDFGTVMVVRSDLNILQKTMDGNIYTNKFSC